MRAWTIQAEQVRDRRQVCTKGILISRVYSKVSKNRVTELPSCINITVVYAAIIYTAIDEYSRYRILCGYREHNTYTSSLFLCQVVSRV